MGADLKEIPKMQRANFPVELKSFYHVRTPNEEVKWSACLYLLGLMTCTGRGGHGSWAGKRGYPGKGLEGRDSGNGEDGMVTSQPHSPGWVSEAEGEGRWESKDPTSLLRYTGNRV